jgi:hypothetical protein
MTNDRKRYHDLVQISWVDDLGSLSTSDGTVPLIGLIDTSGSNQQFRC